MKFSVISGVFRSLVYMQNLRHCFKQQTFTDFEHIVVYDGQPAEDIIQFFAKEMSDDPRLKFVILLPFDGDCATKPRNLGIDISRGDFLLFCDDDDIYLPNYIQTFADNVSDENTFVCCRMNNHGGIIPQNPVEVFPRHGDVGTPMCAYPSSWFKEPYNVRWSTHKQQGDHDFRLVKECCDKFSPVVKIVSPITIIVKGRMEDHYPAS